MCLNLISGGTVFYGRKGLSSHGEGSYLTSAEDDTESGNRARDKNKLPDRRSRIGKVDHALANS